MVSTATLVDHRLVDFVSHDPSRRLACARRILRIPPEELNGLSAFEKGRLAYALEEGLLDTKIKGREISAEIAGRLGVSGRSLIGPLMAALHCDGKTSVRTNAAEALSLTRESPRDERDSE